MQRLLLTILALQCMAILVQAEGKTEVTRSISQDGTFTMSLTYPSGKKVEGLVDMDAYECQFQILKDLEPRTDAHPLVSILLGDIYATGYGGIKDKDKALELFRRGLLSQDKYVRLCARLARAHMFHRLKQYKDTYQELEQIERITPFWDNSSLYFSLSWLGRGNGLSKSEIYICNEKAAQWGHTKGMLACASQLFSGDGTPKDYKASYAYSLLTKGLGEDKDFWQGDLESLEERTKLLEQMLPPAETIKGQQEATILRNLVIERKSKQQEEFEKWYMVHKSFDEWCAQKIGSDFHSAWTAKWKEKIKDANYIELPDKK